MLRFHSLTFLLVLVLAAKAQCEFVGVSVSASDTGLVQLYHPGFFFFGATPNVGGYDNVWYWTIYDMEGKRLDKKVRTIEELFEKNPLEFDQLKIDSMLQRRIKDKLQKHLFKTYEEIYEEVMAQNQKVQAHMKMLIEKYKIPL